MDDKYLWLIEAYDKDNDVWEILYKCSNKYVALLLAHFAGTLIKQDKLVRYTSDGTKEPFDWVEVRQGDYVVKVFPERQP